MVISIGYSIIILFIREEYKGAKSTNGWVIGGIITGVILFIVIVVALVYLCRVYGNKGGESAPLIQDGLITA